MCVEQFDCRPLDGHSQDICVRACAEWDLVVAKGLQSLAHRVTFRVMDSAGADSLAQMIRVAAATGHVHQDLLRESMGLWMCNTLEQSIEGVHAKCFAETLHPGRTGDPIEQSNQLRPGNSLNRLSTWQNKLLFMRVCRRKYLFHSLFGYGAQHGRSLTSGFVRHASLSQCRKALHHNLHRQVFVKFGDRPQSLPRPQLSAQAIVGCHTSCNPTLLRFCEEQTATRRCNFCAQGSA